MTPPEKQTGPESVELPGPAALTEPGSCSIYLGTIRIGAAPARPEKAPAGQHEQRRQPITFMPAQVIGDSRRIVNHEHPVSLIDLQ